MNKCSTSKAALAGAALRGVAAGLAGTLTMDLLWYRRYKQGGGEDSFLDWEFSAGTTGYDEAGAPAQVGKIAYQRVLGHEPPASSARTMNNAVHLLTGCAWGAQHGVAASAIGTRRLGYGLLTGATAWAASYATLAPLGVYKPIWKYPAGALWQDLSAHLVFGLATGTAYGAIARPLTARGSAS